MDRNELSLKPHHLRVPLGASKTISERMVCLEQTCTYLPSRWALSPNGPKRASTWASSSSNSIGCILNNFLACGTFAKPMHLSCTYTNTVSKRTEMRFEFHPVCPKQFLSLRNVQHEPCTYLASRLSPNGPKWVSTWASSPRSTIGCNENNFWAYGTLAQIVQPSCTYNNSISKWIEMRLHITHVTSEFHPVRSKRFSSWWYVRRKPCTYCVLRLAISLNGPKQVSTWALLPRSTNGCI
jgi:hypothetical protein